MMNLIPAGSPRRDETRGFAETSGNRGEKGRIDSFVEEEIRRETTADQAAMKRPVHDAVSSFKLRLIKRARHAAKSSAPRLIFYANRVVKHPRLAARPSFESPIKNVTIQYLSRLRSLTLTPRAAETCLTRKRD